MSLWTSGSINNIFPYSFTPQKTFLTDTQKNTMSISYSQVCLLSSICSSSPSLIMPKGPPHLLWQSPSEPPQARSSMGVAHLGEQEPYRSLSLALSPICSLVSDKATESLKEDGDTREESTSGSAQELTDQQVPGDRPMLCKGRTSLLSNRTILFHISWDCGEDCVGQSMESDSWSSVQHTGCRISGSKDSHNLMLRCWVLPLSPLRLHFLLCPQSWKRLQPGGGAVETLLGGPAGNSRLIKGKEGVVVAKLNPCGCTERTGVRAGW